MTRNLFNPSSVEESVVELDSFRNDILGAAAFSFGLTALQFEKSASVIASVALVFFLLWTIVKLLPKSAEHRRFYESLEFWEGNFRALWKNLVLLAGLGFLGFVATGTLTLERLRIFDFARVVATCVEWLAK